VLQDFSFVLIKVTNKKKNVQKYQNATYWDAYDRVATQLSCTFKMHWRISKTPESSHSCSHQYYRQSWRI